MANGFQFSLRWDLGRFRPDKPIAEFRRAAGVALYRFVEGVVVPRAVELCPIDIGNLRASKQTYPPVHARQNISVMFGFGNAAVQYAAAVHENLTARHAPPTQAKFAEQAMIEGAPRLAPEVQATMRDLLGA